MKPEAGIGSRKNQNGPSFWKNRECHPKEEAVE